MRDTSTRVTWLMLFMVAGLLVLAGQLYRLTVSQSTAFRVQAEQNMLRELPSFGPRGAIYDAKGRSLATSEPAFAAVLVNQEPDHVAAILPQLSLVLANGDPKRAEEIAARVTRKVAENKKAWRQYEPLTIERKLDKAVVTTMMERRGEFPGVVLVEESARNYPLGSLAAPVLGYVGQISAEELQEEDTFAKYHPEEIVGKAGLERFYESYLRGKPGRNSVIVDPWGKPVSGFDVTPPEPGNNLYLTLDKELQLVAEEALAKQMDWIRSLNDKKANPVRGSLVVQDVRTGAVLAMVTVPTYDSNVMSRPTEAQLAQLMNTPGIFYNWAIRGFAPGSTFKMATGLAAMEEGIVGPYERIDCPATYWRYGNPRNWTGYNQGPADVARALSISCNPYFWEVSHLMGIEKMAAFYDKLGFGRKTGIDLPSESAGVNPTKESYGDRWFPGNVINVAIGQGDVLATPLQLANYTAAIATSGLRYKPYLVSEIRTASGQVLMKREPELLGKVEASEQSWKRLQEGMRMAVTTAEGTAHLPFLNFPINVSAKTGSAEYFATGHAHSLSVAYAPSENPEIAVSVIIEGGATGSWSTPVIRRVMAQYFGIQDVIPKGVPTYETAEQQPRP